jgi:hypothetical protein
VASTQVRVGDGHSALFWRDAWLDGQSIQDLAPDLAKTVPLRIQRARTVTQTLDENTWCRDIQGALTIHVLIQYIHTRQRIQGYNVILGVADRFIWRRSQMGLYSSASAYNALFVNQTSLFGAKELWKVCAPNSCRFFIWLVLHGRCWTSDQLQRHGLQNSSPFALCNQAVETLDHLLVQCVVARETWLKILRPLGWQHLTPSTNVSMVACMVSVLSQAGDQSPSEGFQLISILSHLESMAGTQQQNLQQDGFYGGRSHFLYLMSC